MKRFSLVVATFSLAFGLLSFGPSAAQAELIFSDDVEDGVNGWTATGLWHVQSAPEEISISSDFNPGSVSLPDDGSLPSAHSGDEVWWYGAAEDGTFMGDYDETDQWEDNGGQSDQANTGDLISPEIDLTAAAAHGQARLAFWTWWEIEGVDVDRYDLMQVQISTDGGENFIDLGHGTINPLNDVDGEKWKPYSSGGLGQVGVWERHVFDLSNYAGEQVVLKFTFDTVDEKYNAFRGWLLDDVRVDTQELSAPTWNFVAQATRECSGSDEIQTPVEFYLAKDQTVEFSYSADAHAYLTAFGSSDWLWDSSVNNSVNLTKGSYVLYVDFRGTKGCPHDTIQASAHTKAGPQSEAVQAGDLLVLNGSRFVGGATVSFSAYSSTVETTDVSLQTAADEVSVVGLHEIDVVVPSTLNVGRYNVTVTNPNGLAKTMYNAVRVTSANAPDIYSVDPEEVENESETELTVEGYYFDEMALVIVGGVPLASVSVNGSGTSITGTLPVGVTPGFQNVVVMNEDGQSDVLVGGLEVADAGIDPFIPDGSFVGAPDTVKGVVVTVTGETSALVTWTAADRATAYRIKLLDNQGNLITIVRTDGTTRIFGNRYLDSETTYRVRVRGVNAYGKGLWSDVEEFTSN